MCDTFESVAVVYLSYLVSSASELKNSRTPLLKATPPTSSHTSYLSYKRTNVQTTTSPAPYFFIYFLVGPIHPIRASVPLRRTIATQLRAYTHIHFPFLIPHHQSNLLYPAHYFPPFQSRAFHLHHLHHQTHARSLSFPPGTTTIARQNCYRTTATELLVACESVRSIPASSIAIPEPIEHAVWANFLSFVPMSALRTSFTGLLCQVLVSLGSEPPSPGQAWLLEICSIHNPRTGHLLCMLTI